MRLTLRNLLAYMDDQLEPADAAEVARMIEASPFATELMHRLRDVSKRLKLGAPKVDSRGLAGDANTVAEYLDHTMSPEQVAEFEKVCLASEVHLAEVTSAHQILALVLGERADVDPQMRRRMYTLPQRAAAEVEEGGETVHVGDVDQDGAIVSKSKRGRRRPEIPEWLREPPKQKNRWLPVGAAAVLLIGAGIGAAVYLMPKSSTGPDAVASNEPAPRAATQPTEAPHALVDASSDSEAAGPLTTGAEEPGSIDSGLVPSPPSTETTAEAARVPDVGTTAVSPVDAAIEPARLPPGPPAPSPGAPAPGELAGSPSPTRGDDPFSEDVPAATRPGHVLEATELVPGGVTADTVEPAVASVGRLINDNDVLLHSNNDFGWTRLSLRDALVPGEELLAAPTYRPGISLRTGEGATAHLLGGSLIRLLAPDENSVPGLHVVDGQVVVSTAGKPGTPLNLKIADETYRITFLTPDATMAVDVRHSLPDGADPLTTPARSTVDLYVPIGSIEYRSTSSGAQTVKGPAFVRLLSINAGGETAASSENTFPAWINGNPLSQVEKWAADNVDKGLKRDEPVEQRLRELTADRKIEVRDLAVHCMTLLGDFQGLLPFLQDTMQRSNWAGQIEAVRRVLARDPQLAPRLQKTLESQCDAKKAKDVYAMLLGFSPRQLQDGAAARLVADLDSDDLDVRVLAFWNLQRVAVGTQGYKPENEPAKRRAAVRAWRDKLEKGQIIPKGST